LHFNSKARYHSVQELDFLSAINVIKKPIQIHKTIALCEIWYGCENFNSHSKGEKHVGGVQKRHWGEGLNPRRNEEAGQKRL